MELLYMVRGADGKPYGPASLEQLSAWAQEGRLQRDAAVKRSDMEHWAPAGDFTELQPIFGEVASGPAASRTAVPPAAVAAPKLNPASAGQMKASASWFYWIAGLSLVNSIAALSGSSWRFLFGLGITQLIDAFGASLGGAAKVIVLVLDLLVAGVFVLFGVFANKGQLWAFAVGMVLFGLDGLLLVLVKDWLGVGFHAFVLYLLYRGFIACRRG